MSSSADRASSPPGSATPGESFGRYQLLELIGKGGMGEVFRATAGGMPGSDCEFVVKRIRPDKSDSPKFVNRFCEEARISALLQHPNVVQVYDFGHIDGAYFMVMEYLRGKDLSTVMRAVRARRGGMPAALAVFVAREIAHALHYAHTLVLPDGSPAGIVHRDVTPSNIMLLTSGRVKILDFGLAKAASLARLPDASGKPPRLAGKLAYLSPELVRGAPIDHRSDVFSLGVVLWEMVAGQRLFAGENETDTLSNVLTQPIAAPSRRREGIPAALDAIAARALEREPANRYETAEAFAIALDRLLVEMPAADHQPIPALLEELFGGAPPKRGESEERPSVTYFASDSAPAAVARRAIGSRIDFRSIMLPPAPKFSLFTLIGIFAAVVATAVTVGRLLLRH